MEAHQCSAQTGIFIKRQTHKWYLDICAAEYNMFVFLLAARGERFIDYVRVDYVDPFFEGTELVRTKI